REICYCFAHFGEQASNPRNDLVLERALGRMGWFRTRRGTGAGNDEIWLIARIGPPSDGNWPVFLPKGGQPLPSYSVTRRSQPADRVRMARRTCSGSFGQASMSRARSGG